MTSFDLLAVNWQDLAHPRAGGAEVHLHALLSGLVTRGHRVTQVCCGFPEAPEQEIREGIRILRTGRRSTFNLTFPWFYTRHLRHLHFDCVIEDINKIPCYTPLFIRGPHLVIVPHLFGTTAFREVAFPLAMYVLTMELLLPLVYRHEPFQAISESTAEDLVRRGNRESAIRVVYPGVDRTRYKPQAERRSPDPLLLYVGRIKRYKGIERPLRAFARVADRHPQARFLIAGEGDHFPRLYRESLRLGLGERVEFLDRIGEAEKVALLQRAWLVVYPSPKEGWGLVSLEAQACGTPVLASDSPGLRETVQPQKTGWLVAHDDVEGWASYLDRALGDPALCQKMGEAGVEFAGQFSWESAVEATEEMIAETVEAGRRHRTGREGRTTPSMPITETDGR